MTAEARANSETSVIRLLGLALEKIDLDGEHHATSGALALANVPRIPRPCEFEVRSDALDESVADCGRPLAEPCGCAPGSCAEVTAFIVGDHFDSPSASSAPRGVGGEPSLNYTTKSDSRGKGTLEDDHMAEFNHLVNRAHDELDLLVASAQSKRQD